MTLKGTSRGKRYKQKSKAKSEKKLRVQWSEAKTRMRRWYPNVCGPNTLEKAQTTDKPSPRTRPHTSAPSKTKADALLLLGRMMVPWKHIVIVRMEDGAVWYPPFMRFCLLLARAPYHHLGRRWCREPPRFGRHKRSRSLSAVRNHGRRRRGRVPQRQRGNRRHVRRGVVVR